MERRVRATSTDGFGPGIARDQGSTRDTRDGSWRRWKMAARSGWSPPRARREALRCKKGAKGTTAGQSGRKSKKLTHLFEYDGAGAWKMALLMSDTCSAHEDSKGSSPRILSSLVFLPRPAQKLPHISTPPNTESARDARRDGRVNHRAAPTVFTRVCVIRTPFPREHTLRANPRRRSATGGALTVPTDATFRARWGERERGACRIYVESLAPLTIPSVIEATSDVSGSLAAAGGRPTSQRRDATGRRSLPCSSRARTRVSTVPCGSRLRRVLIT